MNDEPFSWAAMVPELACSDLATSLTFYIDMLGAKLEYDRPGFAYISFGKAHMMLEQVPENWSVGPLERPFGRGVNFQIEVENIVATTERLKRAEIDLYRNLQENWYRANDIERGQIEVLVQDPDGYLLRLISIIGIREARITL